MQPAPQRPRPRKQKKLSATATGLTTKEWNHLIDYYTTNPDRDPETAGPDDLRAAATAAANRTRYTPLPQSYMQEARRIALVRIAQNKELPQCPTTSQPTTPTPDSLAAADNGAAPTPPPNSLTTSPTRD